MKTSILSFLILSVFVMSCGGNKVRKNPPVPSSPNELITGCYYIIDDTTALKRTIVERDTLKTYYIDPKAIMTVGDFEEVDLSDEDGWLSINIKLNEQGKKAFARATKNYKGRKLAFVIRDGLVMAPTVYEEITGGAISINGNFQKEKLERYLEVIHFEMYQ